MLGGTGGRSVPSKHPVRGDGRDEPVSGFLGGPERSPGSVHGGRPGAEVRARSDLPATAKGEKDRESAMRRARGRGLPPKFALDCKKMSASAISQVPRGWFGYDRTKPDPALRDDPFPVLNRIREEVPVHVSPLGTLRLFRHADVTRLLKDTRVGVRTLDGRLPGVDESIPRRFMLQQDPPNHTRLRRLVSRAFTPPAIAAMDAHVSRLVDDMLDRVAEQEEMDVIADLARPLPSTVICEMLGVPLSDRDLFTDWTAQVTHLLAPMYCTEEERTIAIGAAANLWAYMADLIEQRRGQLGEDMLSVLIRAEEQGDRLSPEEVIVHGIGLLVAGFETTIGLVGNGVRQLLLHPQELDKLLARPELIGPAVEECLRFDGPIPGTLRVLHEPATFGGFTFPENTPVFLSLAAAQRDPRVFPNPDVFSIERDNSAHLAFGGGIHFCLGAHLARMEARRAIGTLFERFPGLSLVSSRIQWGQSLFRIQERLPVRLGDERRKRATTPSLYP